MADLTLADLDRLDALYEATPAGYAEILAAWPSVSAQLRRALAVPTCPCGDVDCKGDTDDVEPPGLAFVPMASETKSLRALAADGVIYEAWWFGASWRWRHMGQPEAVRASTETEAIAAANKHNAARLARQGTP